MVRGKSQEAIAGGIQHAVTLQGPDGGCAAGKLVRLQRCVGCKRDSTG